MNCNGRAFTSKSVNENAKITNLHSHLPDQDKLQVLKHKKYCKVQSEKSMDKPRRIIRDANIELNPEAFLSVNSDQTMKKFINRNRNRKFNAKNPSSLTDIVIPEQLKYTLKSESRFFYGDSNDENRILIFTTKQNINILNEAEGWLVDGTFDQSPLIFRRLFTIQAYYRG